MYDGNTKLYCNNYSHVLETLTPGTRPSCFLPKTLRSLWWKSLVSADNKAIISTGNG